MVPKMTTTMKMSGRQYKLRVVAVLMVFSILVMSVHGRPSGNSTEADDNYDPLKPDVPPDEQTSAAGAFGGDMMLSPDQMAAFLGSQVPDDVHGSRRVKRKATTNLVKRWPQNTIPYVIEETSSADSDVIRNALLHWEEKTCLQFVPYTLNVGNQLGHHQHISFFKGSDCWSSVGKTGNTGAQKISIGPKCAKYGTIVHEVGHSIGFFHEQSRPDRDDYVVVNEDNIQPDELDNYKKRTPDLVFSNFSYDLKSIMHYRAYSFAVNESLPTMMTVNPLFMRYIGQRKGLSFLDAKTANTIYDCSLGCPSMSCSNEGYVGPNCTCVCTEEFTGPQCLDTNPDYEPPCESVLTSPSGYIESPNFGNGNYPANIICGYHIKPTVTEPNVRITLTFDAFSLEVSNDCEWDYVRVFNKHLTYGGQVFCGSTLPAPITSIGPEMVIWFRSDNIKTMPGFRANYRIEVVPPTTTRHSTEPSVTLKPPTETAVTTKPLTEPVVTTKPLTEPAITTKPLTEPVVTTKPLTEPVVTTKPLTEPAVTTKPLTKPAVTTKPLTEPSVATKPTSEPFVTTKPTTLPPTTAKPSTEPAVTTKTTTEPHVTTKATTKPPITTLPPVSTKSTTEPGVTTKPTTVPPATTKPATEPAVTTKTTIVPPVTTKTTSEPHVSTKATTKPAVTSKPTKDPVITTKPTTVPADTTKPTTEPAVTAKTIAQTTTASSEFLETFTGSSGVLESPNYPNTYPKNVKGTYTIAVPAGQRIVLEFTDFQIESDDGVFSDSTTCSFDYVEVYLGHDIRRPMRLCGNRAPEASLVSLANTMTLEFVSDGSVEKRGFSASYHTINDSLPEVLVLDVGNHTNSASATGRYFVSMCLVITNLAIRNLLKII